MNLEHETVVQKIGDERYLVRFKRQRVGEVVRVKKKWHYFGETRYSRVGYDTQDEAVNRLIASSTGIKQPSDYPRLQFRLFLERIKWFRGYAKRKHTSMSRIVKDYIEQLYQQDHSN